MWHLYSLREWWRAGQPSWPAGVGQPTSEACYAFYSHARPSETPFCLYQMKPSLYKHFCPFCVQSRGSDRVYKTGEWRERRSSVTRRMARNGNVMSLSLPLFLSAVRRSIHDAAELALKKRENTSCPPPSFLPVLLDMSRSCGVSFSLFTPAEMKEMKTRGQEVLGQ